MPSTIYKFELQIDATEAEAAARAFRETVERELGQIQTTPKGGGILGPEIKQATQAVEQTKAAIKSAEQQLDEMARSFARMDAHELRAGMSKAVADARELRSVLEGIQPPKVNTAQIRSQLEDFYNTYAHFNEQTPAFIAARSQGLVPHMGVLGMGRGEIDGAKMAPPEEWSVNTAGAMKAARTSEQEYAQAQVRYYEALATEAKAGEALIEKLAGEMGSDAGMARVIDEYEQLDNQTQRWAEQQAEALDGLGQAQAELARITQGIEADAQAAVTKARNQEALTAGDFGTLTGSGGGGGADATIRVTATAKAADAYERIQTSMSQMAVDAQTISGAETKTAEAISKAATYYAELESARRKEEMDTRQAMANAEKLLQVEKTSTEEKKRAAAELRKGTAEIAKQTQAEKTKTEAAKASTVAAQTELQAQKATTAETVAQAHVRKRAADAEYQERTQAARAAANIAIEQERRITAATRSETAARSRLSGMAGNMGRNLLWAGAGALGLYGIDGAVRTAMQAGKQGAAMMQTEESFRGLADRMEVDADRMIKAIQRASGETLSEMDAISYGVQVMAQRFASSSDDIGGDTALLIEYARRLSQMGFADAEGNFLEIGDVMSRLIGFTREGNKELVDQFGLSNQVIADLMGVTKDGLAGATGAATRWAGMLKFAQEEMERLGPAATNTASEIANSEARITDAMNRIRASAAEPIAFVVEVVADGADFFSQGGKNSVLEGKLATLLGQAPGALQQAVLQQQSGWNDGMSRAAGLFSNEWLAESIKYIEETIPAVENLTAAYTALGDEARMAADPVGTKQAQLEWDQIVAHMQDGSLSGQELADRAAELAAQLGVATTGAAGMKGEIAGAADEAAELTEEARAAAAALNSYQTIMAERGRTFSLTEAQRAAMTDAERAAYARSQNNARSLTALASSGASDPFASVSRARSADALGKLYDEQAKLEIQIAKDRQALDKSTASAAASAWKSAAAQTVAAFDSAISKIPGIGGLSPVTQEQLDAAKAGIPQNFADNYLRRLEDEIVNKVDWAGVDVGDAARRMGMDPGTDPMMVLQQMKGQWASGELFAGGNNLDLIDLDAVKAAYDQQARQEDGQKELRKYIGKALGIDVDALDAQAKATYATTDNTTSLDENTAALDEVNAQIAALNAPPPPAPVSSATTAATTAATPAPYQYTDAQRQVMADAQAYAAAQGKAKALRASGGGGMPIEGGALPMPTTRPVTPPPVYMGGSIPIEGGKLAAKGLGEANLPAIGPALPAIVGGMISAMINDAFPGLAGSLGDQIQNFRIPDEVIGQMVEGPAAALGKTLAESMGKQSRGIAGMVPNATGGYSPLVGMPNPSGLIDLLAAGSGTLSGLMDQVMDAQIGRQAGSAAGKLAELAAQGLGEANLPAIGPALPGVAGGLIAALIDQMMGSPDGGTGNGPQDMVAGSTVYTPWKATPPEQPPLPPVDAQGYGRPLIPGLDTPPGLTSGHMGGDTLTTPAPYTDIQTQTPPSVNPYGGLGDSLLPSWLTGTGTAPEDVKIYLPLVTKGGSLEEMLGDQPETIGVGLMDKIGAAVEGVPLVKSIKAIWDRDIQDNGAELVGVGEAIAGKINTTLERELGSLSGGGLVATIVANVLEALAGEE